jgi:F420 biosynthesis protein FbiB-like protein
LFYETEERLSIMASEFLKMLTSRRSIRTYLPKEVPQKIVFRILEAARWAPSAHNAQPWRFIVIRDHNLKRRLAEAMATEWAKDLARDCVSPDACKQLVKDSIERFTDAPLLIVAFLTMEDMDTYLDEKRQKIEHTMAVQSLAAAVQNVLLAAHSEVLGSCWFCAPLFCQDTVRKVVKAPENVEPQALITLGYPSEEVETPSRKPLRELAFKNRWGERF